MGSSDIILWAKNAGWSREARPGDPVWPVRISLACEENVPTLLWGEEGCGKNVLLRALGLLDVPDEGEIYFRETPTSGFSSDARAWLRNHHFGFLFAEPFLLPALSVVENIAMPLMKISSATTDEARDRTQAMLDFIGMSGAAEWEIDRLSMFEQQKVALARALINQPDVLIVENVDAMLHGEELQRFVEIINLVNTTFGTTPVLTARSEAAVPVAGRVVHIVDGAVEQITDTATKKGGATE